MKVNPIQYSNVEGIQMSSSLAPQHVPKSMELVSTEEFMLIKIFYEVNVTEKTEELDLEGFLRVKESIKGLVICVGKQSKRLVSIQIPHATFSTIKQAQYSSVQQMLNEVREKNPRWGSFAAGANIFQEYGKSINRQPREYAQ
jgi:hypothetical protein